MHIVYVLHCISTSSQCNDSVAQSVVCVCVVYVAYVWHERKLEVAIRQLLLTPATPQHCLVHNVKCTLHIVQYTM